MNKYNGKVILVVDDTAFLRNSLVNELEALGVSRGRILTAENGKEGLDYLASGAKDEDQVIDLVLCDWNMPIMTGIELLKKVRNSDKPYKNIPFALVTTVSEKDKIIEALSFNLSGYILKPIDVQKLKELLINIFGE